MKSRMSLLKCRSLAAILGATALAVTLSGCECLDKQILDPINVNDEDTLARTGSMIVRPLTMAMGNHNQGGVEFNYERYRGHSEQRIDLNHYVETGEGPISGPQIIDNTADSESGRIAYNHLLKFGPHFELEPSLGVTYERMTVTTQSRLPNARLETIEDKALGLGLSVAPRFVVNEFIAIEGRVGAIVDEDSDTAFTSNMALVLSPIPNIALRGGYYWRDQDIESLPGESDLEIEFEGMLASVTLRF